MKHAGSAGVALGLVVLVVLDVAAAEDKATGRIGFFLRSDLNRDYELYYLGVDWPPSSPAWGDHLRRLTWAAGFSGRPSAVGISTGFAVAWEDDRDGNTEIYFATMNGSGVLDGPARRITSAPGDSPSRWLSMPGASVPSPRVSSRGSSSKVDRASVPSSSWIDRCMNLICGSTP